MFKNYIFTQKNNIISSVCDLITYPSISETTNNSHFPFGKACSDSLKYFLDLATSLGFRTKNVDGYCGYAEFGSGDELIGIVGHLDVVPAKEEDWTYSPFTPTIAHNRIYGRGAIDDKGPVISCLYAMKAVMEYLKDNDIELNKRIRLIVGLNEEKNWKCIDYYKEHEEIPSIGFSPDSDFPCIYAEKSVVSILLSDKIDNFIYNDIKRNHFRIFNKYPQILIEEIDYGNNAINVVPKYCSVILKISNNIMMRDFIYNIKNIIDRYNYDIDIYKIDNYRLKLTSYGTASHSAHPELGVNAISKLILVLNDIFYKYGFSNPLISNFCKYIGDDYLGNNMNINIEDESGKLTLNSSQFYIQNNKLCIGINLRIPVHTTPDEIIDKFNEIFNKNNVETLRIQPALYIDKENTLVQKLCKVFNDICGTNLEPIAIGGATYARAFDNFVCFGMNFPGDKDMCHQADEFIDIDKLLLSTNIYANAIYELIKN